MCSTFFVPDKQLVLSLNSSVPGWLFRVRGGTIENVLSRGKHIPVIMERDSRVPIKWWDIPIAGQSSPFKNGDLLCGLSCRKELSKVL